MQQQHSALQLEVAMLQVQSGQKTQEDVQLTVTAGDRHIDLLLNIRKAEAMEGSEVGGTQPLNPTSLLGQSPAGLGLATVRPRLA